MRDLSENERELLLIIWHGRSLARSDVARYTHLAQQSVHRLLDGLRAEGMLAFGEADIRGRGKPSPSVRIDPTNHAGVGIAVSAAQVRYSVVDLAGQPLEAGALSAPPNDRDAVLAELSGLFTGWSQTVLSGRRVVGLGVAMDGYRALGKDKFRPGGQLEGWQDLPLCALFEDRFRLPCYVINDASAAALTERVYGDAAEVDCYAHLALNDDFGAGVLWRDRILNGHFGNAGNIGALLCDSEGAQVPGLTGLLARLQANGVPVSSTAELVRDFRSDWPGIAGWVRDVGPSLRMALRALKAIADPGAVYIGGEAPAPLRQMLIAECASAWEGQVSPSPRLAASSVDGDAAHLGAALLPLHMRIYQPKEVRRLAE